MKLKKGITQIEAIRSVRKTWGFVPTTRVIKSKKVYSRKKKNAKESNES